VADSNYIVVISTTLTDETSKSVDEDESVDRLFKPSMTKLPRLFFHRLDVLPAKQQSKLCRHFVAPATLESGTLFMSTDAFLEPWERSKVVRSLVRLPQIICTLYRRAYIVKIALKI
jgi:hypothetical protein